MILLNGHSLTDLKKVDLEKQSLTLRERDSTSLIQPVDMSDIGINSWFRDEKSPGAGIVWRVKNLQQMYNQKAAQVQLEHVINTLKDRILFGEITPATITGSDSAAVCTARQAITYILNQQSDWVLYNFDASYESVSNNYKFNGDSLFDALDRVTKTLSDAWWSYDMSVYPFRLNITAMPSGLACELRPGRNLKTASRTIDRGNMYTRFYPIGHDDLHITGNYVSQNESTYGVISKVEVDMSLTTEAELTAWANEKLSRHCEPIITIMADGLELAGATGESLDALTLGRICRVYVDEFGTTIQERITDLTYADKVNQPENVRVTMSNKREDVLQYMADVVNEIKEGAGPSGSGRSGGGGRGGASQQREDHAWFEDTDEHVAMVAEGIVGVDAQGNPNWVRLSQLIVDGAGIHGNVTSLLDGDLYHQSIIEMNEDKISLVVGRYNNQNYIKAGEICLAINATTGESMAKILANHVIMDSVSGDPIDVVINGKLTTTSLYSEIAGLNSVQINTLNILTLIDAPLITGTEGAIDEFACDYLSLSGSTKFDDCLVDASVSNNELTLTYASGDTVTFSKAVDSWSTGWIGGEFTAKANPQNQSTKTQLHQGTASWSGNNLTVPIQAKDADHTSWYNTGFSVQTTGVHDMGIRQATKSGTTDTMTVTAACQPDGHTDAATKDRDYQLVIDGSNSSKVNLVYNGTVYASKTVSGGGGGGTPYSMYCSYKTSAGGGLYSYTFTLTHSTSFTVGNSYQFYR